MSAEREQVLVVRKVMAGSVYKLLLCGLVIGFIPVGLLFGVMGFFGADTVKWNGHPIHGGAALFAGVALFELFALVFTALLGTIASLGLWVYSRFRPMIIWVVMAQQWAQADAPDSGGPAPEPGVGFTDEVVQEEVEAAPQAIHLSPAPPPAPGQGAGRRSDDR